MIVTGLRTMMLCTLKQGIILLQLKIPNDTFTVRKRIWVTHASPRSPTISTHLYIKSYWCFYVISSLHIYEYDRYYESCTPNDHNSYVIILYLRFVVLYSRFQIIWWSGWRFEVIWVTFSFTKWWSGWRCIVKRFASAKQSKIWYCICL